jgi:large subunit ribosomal protein L27e
MSLTYKPGRIVILLNGRFSGCKAVIVNNNCLSNQNSQEKFESVILLGIQRYPCNITKKMSKTKIIQKSKIKIFLKSMNKNHFLPTRYNIDFGEENSEKIKSFALDYLHKKKNKLENEHDLSYKNQKYFIKNLLLERYLSNKNKWFFQRLKF